MKVIESGLKYKIYCWSSRSASRFTITRQSYIELQEKKVNAVSNVTCLGGTDNSVYIICSDQGSVMFKIQEKDDKDNHKYLVSMLIDEQSIRKVLNQLCNNSEVNLNGIELTDNPNSIVAELSKKIWSPELFPVEYKIVKKFSH